MKKQIKILTIRLDAELMEKLKKTCDTLYGVAQSKFVRKAIEEKIERELKRIGK